VCFSKLRRCQTAPLVLRAKCSASRLYVSAVAINASIAHFINLHEIGSLISSPCAVVQLLSITQIYAMLLVQLKKVVHAKTGAPSQVVDAVIAVPCYYNDFQRRAVLDAAKISGINCMRLINETAAGTSYRHCVLSWLIMFTRRHLIACAVMSL
jgi:molecular chaperone DnaK (HSP70)